MLKHRIIPCVLLKDWQMTKSIRFQDYRTIGHPKVTAGIYNRRNVDELIVLDIDASRGNNSMNLSALKEIAEECFMPLTIGGGIKSLDDISKLLTIGADKVSINTKALAEPSFIKKAAEKFGSQCIVVSVDVIMINDKYKVYNKNLGIIERLKPEDWIEESERLGAGEILLTSVERDGTEEGYDLELISFISKNCRIPLIANGGASKPQDCIDALKSGADAVAAASIFHFSQYTPNSIKKLCLENNISVRKL